MANGKVYLVGAGTGDFELITLKGYRLICQADVDFKHIDQILFTSGSMVRAFTKKFGRSHHTSKPTVLVVRRKRRRQDMESMLISCLSKTVEN